MLPFLNIAGRRVADDAPAFVIAEIGVNHDGRRDTALRLVEAAWEAGADAVKLQLFRADSLVHASGGLAAYQKDSGEQSPAAMLRRLELSEADVADVVAAVRAAGMVPLATPFSPEDVRQIRDLNLPAVKLASPDLVNPLLIDAASDLSVPMLLSTGAATADEIEDAVCRLCRRGIDRFALLHCVSAYPTPDREAEIGRVRKLADRYECVVGLSDHTQNLLAGAIGVSNGARIVEKHLTHDRSAKGPDHSASASPSEFTAYVGRIRETEALLGIDRVAGERDVGAHELDVRVQSRQSLVARRAIKAGQPISRDLLTCQRPGTGIPAASVERVCQLTALRDIPAGALVDWSDLQQAPLATPVFAA